MPYLGDIRLRNPDDQKRLDAAENYNEQRRIMSEITEFEVWDGTQWISGCPTYVVAK